MTTLLDDMQQEASEAFRDGRIDELPEEWKLAMIARNRVRFHGMVPQPVALAREIQLGTPLSRACLTLGTCEESE